MGLLFLLTILQLFPAAWFFYKKRQMSFIVWVGLSHFIGYSLIPWYFFIWERKPLPLSSQSTLLLIFATLTLGFAYYLGKLLIPSNPKFKLQENPPSELSTSYYLLAIFISFLLLKYLPIEFKFLLKGIQFLFLVFAVKHFIKDSRRQSLLHFATLLFFCLYSYLEYKNVEFAIFLVLLLFTLAIFHQSRRPIAFGFASLCVLIFLQTQKGEYRTFVGNEKASSLVEKIELFYSIVNFKYFGGATPERLPASFVAEATDRAVSRIYDDSLEKVLLKSPTPVPYWKGKSYSVFFHLLLAPLFPSSWNLWHEFGERYGYLSSDDKVTEVVFSYFAEGYMNFGITGIFTEAFLVGILLFLLEWIALNYFHRFHFEASLCLLIPMLSYQTDLGGAMARVVISLCLLLIVRNFFLFSKNSMRGMER